MSSPPPAKKPRVNGGAPSHIREVCIVGVARTPCGSLQGKLSALKASDLAGVAIKEALNRAEVQPADVEELVLGHVISAGAGQAPAKQAAVSAGLPQSVVCSSVNKVCASGMKAVMLGAQSIMLGLRDVVVVGGMESMSQAPHLSKKARGGARYGDLVFSDALQTDGLFDAFENIPMGDIAEECARKNGISREAQDAYAAESYRRAREATANGDFKREVVEVQVPPPKRGAAPQTVTEDEEVVARMVDVASLSKLRPCFKPSKDFGPTVTAGNASPISDGAAALVLMSRNKVEALGLGDKVQAVVRSFADAEQEPRLFTTSPALAIPKALANAGLTQDAVDYFEINEAFSVVACANTKLLGLDAAKVNVYGGAVAIGHPLGCSGARIIVTLCSVLHQEGGRIGCAAVCNGGGGASAIVIEKA
ncbi:putative acetyl-CoA acetyltransferase, cytosolic 2 [Phytophthora rubi]|uniref:Putative acetyl-CoA acetyltransferase, cytosolic 2 n=1 Tax=Phytophthora rubi TaxID=129364 RepID=A0A6A3MS85_9STRA|nr:putative acetyl-CoA acetyltransferase, cytosolic 2 [Phytophthora rubi]KAE9038113.1 putative acetyl-CoA acetyltransferase, cytosolic 2 [Phytophthora rubi]KAE9344039.1 putative acetyl-CoA acetyltransferase, cytosolic 2 [Phytophthora rubi]